MKHTPGPWTYAMTYWQSRNHWYVFCDANGYGPIMEVDGQYKSGQIDERETAANARLIAAAPELLEVCNAVLEWQKAFLKLDFDLEKKLRQAIAKAAGVTNEKESN